MRIYIFTIPLIAAVITIVYLIVKEMTRVWLNHRTKLLLLKKLESKPELLYSFEELQELLDDRPSVVHKEEKTDITMTGLFLTGIGLLFVVLNAVIGRSQWGVGAYFGGVICVVIGFLLATIGLMIRFLRRPPK